MKTSLLLLITIIIYISVFFTTLAQSFLTSNELNEDLDQFQTELEERFAYLKANNADYIYAINSIREKGVDGMDLIEFGIELDKVIGLFIDCHGAVYGFEYPDGYLPFKIEPAEGRYVAFWPDRTSFVDDSYPFIRKVDDRTIDDWCEILKVFVPNGSPQFVRYVCLWYITQIKLARREAGDEDKETFTLELESRSGDIKTVTMDVTYDATSLNIHRYWPETNSAIIEGNIGYLRLTRMNESAFQEIDQWMPQFVNTDGLIIDVRDNRGGTRAVLWELFPYFCTEFTQPLVANAAKYRLYHEFGPDHLASRMMFTQDWVGWTNNEQESIVQFMQNFQPEWIVPENEFSEWHFWVLSKKANPAAYYFSKPVVFLMNEKCQSASDVTLSAIKGFGNITLVGLPSSGSSGAVVLTTLKNSGFGLRLSSMASFQKDGKLFDSFGVEPDTIIGPSAQYFIFNGPDRMLDKAIEIINGSVNDTTTGFSSIPLHYELIQNYPNPFNPITIIKYQLPASSKVTLKIYDILGNEVITLLNEEKETGTYEVIFNASNYSSGVYFYRIQAGSFVETKKMVLMK
jgi:hypothetical protein